MDREACQRYPFCTPAHRIIWRSCGATAIVWREGKEPDLRLGRLLRFRGWALLGAGAVRDSIALGRRWRNLGLLTPVGTSVNARFPQGERASIDPTAYCESMCVYLLLSGKTRYVPAGAHVRVHQIWMGDRADDAKAASYTAQDMMIVERDIGRLAKYTFDMGGPGDLLSLALSVPPWEDLHELSPAELRLTNLATTDAVADVLPRDTGPIPLPMAEAKPKASDRFISAVEEDSPPQPAKSNKTAEAH